MFGVDVCICWIVQHVWIDLAIKEQQHQQLIYYSNNYVSSFILSYTVMKLFNLAPEVKKFYSKQVAFY